MSDMEKSVLTTDSWENLLNNQGVLYKDPKKSTTIGQPVKLTEADLAWAYVGDGFAQKIIDLPAQEMTREWFNIEGDSDNVVVNYLDDLQARKKITTILKWARLFGGAVGVMGIDDGGELEEPVDENNIRAVEFIHVFDRYRVTFSSDDLYDDPTKANYGLPEIYTISPKRGGNSFRVHETRILRKDGMTTPVILEDSNYGWGESALVPLWDNLSFLGSTYQAVTDIVKSFETIIISIDNLQQLIAAGKSDVVKQRLNLMDLSRATLNAVLLDSKEKFEKKASSVTGLDKLIQEMGIAVAAMSGIPVTLFLGTSPAGLNATGASDIRQWYDKIAADQETELKPMIERLSYLSMIAKDGPTKGVELPEWSIKFNPLWQPTEKEIAETRKLVAETDDIYIQNQVIHPTEVRESRFGGESYSQDTIIDDSLTKNIIPEDDDNESMTNEE